MPKTLISGIVTVEGQEHIEDCSALREVKAGRWGSPWWVPGTSYYGDKLGRHKRGSSRRWLILQCNNTDCHAELMVEENSLVDFIWNAS